MPGTPRRNLRRSAPSTSTTSPSAQRLTARRARPPQAAQSTQSAVCFDPFVIGEASRGTDRRSTTMEVPLGSSRALGAVETRPRSLTTLDPSFPVAASDAVPFCSLIATSSLVSRRAHLRETDRRSRTGVGVAVEKPASWRLVGGSRLAARPLGRSALELAHPFGGVGESFAIDRRGAVEPLQRVVAASRLSEQVRVGVGDTHCPLLPAVGAQRAGFEGPQRLVDLAQIRASTGLDDPHLHL